MHDIGKVGIRDSILLKPSKLRREEFETVNTHAALGAQTLEAFCELEEQFIEVRDSMED
ncbi:MAG: HD domain-containing protein [Spirochaetia bacterium]